MKRKHRDYQVIRRRVVRSYDRCLLQRGPHFCTNGSFKRNSSISSYESINQLASHLSEPTGVNDRKATCGSDEWIAEASLPVKATSEDRPRGSLVDLPARPDVMKRAIVGETSFFNERCKLTSAIVVLNAIIIAECVVLLVRGSNPFFHSMDHPTPAYFVFMVLQILFLTAAAVCSVAACAGKAKMVMLNRGLFQVVTLTNIVYAIIFFVRSDVPRGLAMGFLAITNVLGAIVCGRFVVHQLSWL